MKRTLCGRRARHAAGAPSRPLPSSVQLVTGDVFGIGLAQSGGAGAERLLLEIVEARALPRSTQAPDSAFTEYCFDLRWVGRS